jgi:hypothetical protein
MEHVDQDVQAAPFGRTAGEESERMEDSPRVGWEDEWVDIGGEG